MRRRAHVVTGAAMLAAALTCAGIAGASTGGVSDGGEQATADSTYRKVQFGARTLRHGHRGNDVKTLNWLLRSQWIGRRYGVRFETDTHRAVRRFQNRAELRVNGVVYPGTRKAFARRMAVQRATWYGPGFWGNRTACGQTLRKRMIGVAHKRLPCGTKVVFLHRGRWVRARVIDRGPYRPGHRWDLTQRTAKRLGFLRKGAGRLRVTVVH